MNTGPFFVIIYQLLFATLSMALITAIEGYGTEMFAGAFYFNLTYIVLGGIGNYIFYVILHRFYFEKRNRLLALHFFVSLLLMNVLIFYLNRSWITWTFITGFLVAHDDGYWVALSIHALMILCYFLAVVSTRPKPVLLDKLKNK